jgi:hypothetical protein
MPSASELRPYAAELNKIYIDALYNSQAYFEASKRLARTARLLVFFPAILAAVAGFLVAVGLPQWIGAVSAVAGAMSATASYLGADRKAAAYTRTAQLFTQLRHDVRRTRDLAEVAASVAHLRASLESFSTRYSEIIGSAEPTDNKDFEVAQKRIAEGAFDYDEQSHGGAADGS